MQIMLLFLFLLFPESSDLVTMMYSLSTYKLFLSQYYLLLTFNKILKLTFHCRDKEQRFSWLFLFYIIVLVLGILRQTNCNKD